MMADEIYSKLREKRPGGAHRGLGNEKHDTGLWAHCPMDVTYCTIVLSSAYSHGASEAFYQMTKLCKAYGRHVACSLRLSGLKMSQLQVQSGNCTFSQSPDRCMCIIFGMRGS